MSALVYSAMLLASVAAIAGGAVDRLMEAAAAAELAQQRLARQAGTDGLTGLANRLAFDAELARRWQDSAGPARVGLLVLDLNRFKEVNDRFGHAAGDELLQAVATRLASQLRPGDVLARLGGDEFAVIHGDAHTELAACGAADRLAAGLLTPVTVPVADLELTATVSIGVAVSPAHAASPDGLLRAADAGMYRAKSAGRPVALYSAAGAQHEGGTQLAKQTKPPTPSSRRWAVTWARATCTALPCRRAACPAGSSGAPRSRLSDTAQPATCPTCPPLPRATEPHAPAAERQLQPGPDPVAHPCGTVRSSVQQGGLSQRRPRRATAGGLVVQRGW